MRPRFQEPTIYQQLCQVHPIDLEVYNTPIISIRLKLIMDFHIGVFSDLPDIAFGFQAQNTLGFTRRIANLGRVNIGKPEPVAINLAAIPVRPANGCHVDRIGEPPIAAPNQKYQN